ncbi:hypothetical protein AAEX37_00510 [Oligella sp. MSHR50489EDL]
MKDLKGQPEVIDYMNKRLAGELAARDRYFIHSRMYAEWAIANCSNVSTTRWTMKRVMPMT